MTNNLYLIFLAVHTLIIIVNYHLLKKPKPIHQMKLGKNLKVEE